MIISLRHTLPFILGMVLLIAVAQVTHAAGLTKIESSPKSTSALVDSDRILLKQARAAFEKKQFKKALSLYEKIPATSDYWPEALEERAWSHVHLKEHDQALAHLKTLFVMPLRAEIGAEPYLLSALMQLRLCNYKELFRIMKKFKEDIRPRYNELQTLAKSGNSPAAQSMLARARESRQLSRLVAGEDVSRLPRLFYRDAKLQDVFYSDLKSTTSEQTAKAVMTRLQELAKRDVADTDTVLRKLHLIEVESVSRMYSEQHLADAKKTSAPIARDANTLVFPDDDKEEWLDETDDFHVNANSCPSSGTKGPKS